MEINEAKEKFIQQWGSLGSNWGINRTMAQIHALFLITEELLSAEDIMDRLKISRGNANMNIRTLIDWGLVYKEYISGERREYFRGERDIWKVAQRVIRVRQRQELAPLLLVLKELQTVKVEAKNKNEVEVFTKQMKSIKSFAGLADNSLTKISDSEENWFLKVFVKFMR